MEATISQMPTKNSLAPWYKHRWPWLLMLGPTLVVIAATYTCYIAFTRQDALVVGDYYKQGRAINQDLRRERNASNLGIKSELHYDPAKGVLSGQVSNFTGVQTGVVAISLVHSTLPSKDMHLETALDAQGRFSIALPLLEMARWQVMLEDQQRTWRVEGEWAWPKEKQLAMAAEIQSAD